jgi:hypothetical protein
LPPPPAQFQAEPQTPPPLLVVPPPAQFAADPHWAEASAIPKGSLSFPILKPSSFFIVTKEKSPQAKDEKRRHKKSLRDSLPIMVPSLFLFALFPILPFNLLLVTFTCKERQLSQQSLLLKPKTPQAEQKE